ncbi:hypothetical protein ABUS55_22840, partial [Citrobacter pasteurii]|uniref:hypothetical protein n=1 Tax=Citrobacter pasteurii TaxID=1563222 RepID=UPI00352DC49F
RSADGSVGSPHARVGNCQALIKVKKPILTDGLFCVCAKMPDASQRVPSGAKQPHASIKQAILWHMR